MDFRDKLDELADSKWTSLILMMTFLLSALYTTGKFTPILLGFCAGGYLYEFLCKSKKEEK